MKSFKQLFAGGVAALAALVGLTGLTGCNDEFDVPPIDIPVATLKPNTTIQELKTEFWQDATNYATLAGKKDNGEDYIIHGRVVSSDATGNIYKTLYIQDETGAVQLSVNANSLYNSYRIGQEVVINVSGLYVGKYAGAQCIGGLGSHNGTPQTDRMAEETFKEHTELNGLPEPEMTLVNSPQDPKPGQGIYCVVTSISDLTAANFQAYQGQLVEIRNVHFQGGGSEPYVSAANKDAGKSEQRTILDASGNSLTVYNSAYASFASQIMPAGEGAVRGILGYFNGTWQLLLRSTADVMFDTKGSKEDPYTVAEAIELQNTGAAGWVNGYIVGSVKAGVTAATNADVIWGADAEMDNTLVIGEAADTKDLAKCLVITLPQGSALRQYGNLIDHPENYKKAIKVYGQFATELGTNGLTGNTGTVSEFGIEGVNPGGGSGDQPGEGDGSKENPYSVAKALEVAKANGETSDVSVYTRGYVISGSIDTSFGNATWVIADDKSGTGATITVYRCKDIDNQKFTDANKVKVGDQIVVYAPLINFKGNTPETSFGYLYSINGEAGTGGSGGTTGGDAGEPAGDGTVDNPYNVAYVMASTADETGVWMEGWIVGYVEGMTWSSGAMFTGIVPADATYNNTNLVIGATKESNSISTSIPIAIPAGSLRDELGLKAAPAMYLKHIKFKGDVTKYFGQRGFKNVSEYQVME